MLPTVEERSSGATPGCSEDPLLTLRFEVPRPPRQHVDRRRLLARLDQGADQPLTLVSAPAGSGKTTLLAAWVAQRPAQQAVGWLTCETGDDGPDQFWPLFTEVLRRCGLTLTEEVSAGSHHPRRRMLTELSASLARMDRAITVVLDGYEVTDAGLGSDLDFVLRHSGSRLRLVMLTRADPVMPLHRLRLQETITELRVADLAFTEDETARLLERIGVTLGPQAVTTLVSRTRGWAAGLRFAGMLLARSENPETTVEQLTGDSGNIAEYLMAEMLQRQPVEARELLLRTSVVDILQPGLIEQLGGRSAGRRLAALSRANVLVEELPGRAGWFRYHPFLRDLLRAELAYAAPRRQRLLQRRAARWFASQGYVDEAVALSAASAAWPDAASYAVDALAVGQLLMGDDAHSLVRVLREMPADTTGAAACVVRAALALADNDPDRCATELSDARESVDVAGSPVDAAVELAIDVVETVRARCVGDERAVTLAEEAAGRLEAQAGSGSPAHVALATLIQTSKGVAQFRAGQFVSARETLSEAVQTPRWTASNVLLVSAQAHLALSAALQGRLRAASEWGSRTTTLTDEIALPPGKRPPEAEIALAWVSAERYELSAAREHLKASLASRSEDPIARALSTLVRVRLLRSGSDADQAIKLIDEVGQLLPDHAVWMADLLGIEAAEIRIAQGAPDLAVRIVSDLHLPDVGSRALVLGHAHLKRGDWDAVTESVAALVSPDSTDVSLVVAVGGRLLEAALELHRGHERGAGFAMSRAVRLAAPEHLRRPFLEAPTPVRDMLAADTELLAHNPWLGAAFDPSTTARRARVSMPDAASTLAKGEIIEPLTAKEQEVLGHLSELLTTQEIAETMFVSVNTVRTHVRSILRKLAVSHRNEAVRRARALSLIPAGAR